MKSRTDIYFSKYTYVPILVNEIGTYISLLIFENYTYFALFTFKKFTMNFLMLLLLLFPPVRLCLSVFVTNCLSSTKYGVSQLLCLHVFLIFFFRSIHSNMYTFRMIVYNLAKSEDSDMMRFFQAWLPCRYTFTESLKY